MTIGVLALQGDFEAHAGVLAGLGAALLAGLTACGGDPPQIVDYSPQRNSVDVSTAAPIRLSFDHNVDQASVESRLHINPATPGTIRWTNGRQLVLEHRTLRTNTIYEVILESGYRLNIPRMFAALLLLSVAGIVIFFVLSLFSYLMLRRWHESAVARER